MIQIDTANRIRIDGRETGLALAQRANGTVIYTPESAGARYQEHPMPHARYSTVHDAPASGAAGRRQLEADVRALLATLGDVDGVAPFDVARR